jgi:23S rRNA U2552 (ribose-2'-O)-methylase RlmE/FtsJ
MKSRPFEQAFLQVRNKYLVNTPQMLNGKATRETRRALSKLKSTFPREIAALRFLRQIHASWRGYLTWQQEKDWPVCRGPAVLSDSINSLKLYFEAHDKGRGVWKWNHYFEVYERHFSRFKRRPVRVLEIGIYSGGSLEMWSQYFGPEAQIYGVDIEPACKAYESDSVKVLIGDQADRNFWRRFKREVQALDIVIDDGGHRAEQQIVTLEELLPFLRSGGVYLCEDVMGDFNKFAAYVQGLAHNLNAARPPDQPLIAGGSSVHKTTALQSAVHSIHLYPYLTVIERRDTPLTDLCAPKRGTEWAPFLE